ncbi:MAG: hypothetical protein JOY54_16880 [Acidobacteriaceae bacterium]|nr:hypothetical protein [Acidobacteriaceae bacterium]
MRKLWLTVFGCVLSWAAPLNAQTQLDRGKQTVDRAIAALGGEQFLHLQNRVVKGRIYSFFHDQLSGLDVATIYTQYLDHPPAKGLAVRERELLGKKQDYSYLFLEDQGWDVTYRGARPVADDSWQCYERTTRNDIFYILRERRDEPGMLYDYAGTETYLSTQVDVVEITDANNETIRVYFDHNTMLPVHQSFSWMDPDTKQRNDETADFDKYRDAGGGIMLPYSVQRERNGYKSYQMFATRIDANQSLPPNVFDLPPGAKILKKVE